MYLSFYNCVLKKDEFKNIIGITFEKNFINKDSYYYQTYFIFEMYLLFPDNVKVYFHSTEQINIEKYKNDLNNIIKNINHDKLTKIL